MDFDVNPRGGTVVPQPSPHVRLQFRRTRINLSAPRNLSAAVKSSGVVGVTGGGARTGPGLGRPYSPQPGRCPRTNHAPDQSPWVGCTDVGACAMDVQRPARLPRPPSQPPQPPGLPNASDTAASFRIYNNVTARGATTAGMAADMRLYSHCISQTSCHDGSCPDLINNIIGPHQCPMTTATP